MFRLFPNRLLSVVAGLAMVLAAQADTVTLKSGEKIEGKILTETDAELTIEVVSGGVVDERKVPKAEVASVSKMMPDELAWQPLQGIKLGDNSLPTAEQYDAWLAPLNAFIKQFPESKHKADAEKIAGEFEAEKGRVSGGEVKLNGAWLSREDVERERYQVSGTIAFNYMKSQAARGDVIGAMNTFEIIAKEFDGSRAYLEAIVFARQSILPQLKAQAAQRLAALPAENAERQRGVNANVGLEKARLQKEIETEKNGMETALAEAKKAGIKWPPFLRRSEAAMRDIVRLCDEAENKLATVDITKCGESIKLATEARADIEKKDLESAGKKLRLAQAAWPKNELVVRLNAEHTAAVAAAKAVAAETPKEEPKATPKPVAKATPIPVATTPAAEEEKPSNPLFPIVGAVILTVLAFVGWTAYKKVVKKSNEIIE